MGVIFPDTTSSFVLNYLPQVHTTPLYLLKTPGRDPPEKIMNFRGKNPYIMVVIFPHTPFGFVLNSLPEVYTVIETGQVV